MISHSKPFKNGHGDIVTSQVEVFSQMIDVQISLLARPLDRTKCTNTPGGKIGALE